MTNEEGGTDTGSEENEGVTGDDVAERRVVKAPRPRFCRVFVRARLAEAMPTIVAKLLQEAEKGSVTHIALLLKTAGLDHKDELVPPAIKKPGKSVAALLMEEWDREKQK